MIIHTKKDADNLLYFLKKTGFPKAKIIGSIGKGAKKSKHDIDVLLSGFKRTKELEGRLRFLLEPKREYKSDKKRILAYAVTKTDWGGLYFHNTYFGNVDIFFTTKDFDY